VLSSGRNAGDKGGGGLYSPRKKRRKNSESLFFSALAGSPSLRTKAVAGERSECFGFSLLLPSAFSLFPNSSDMAPEEEEEER